MRRILFVSNGHGECAIAERIAREVRALAVTPVGLDHVALVGEPPPSRVLAVVGPRRTLPSGGLVAMGNASAFARDLRAGFLGLFASQLTFLRREGGRYDRVVAVGDAYALALALQARRPAIFVGTAKSVYVARYGAFERRILRRAEVVFVRDEATAFELLAEGVRARAPGNVIVDLIEGAPPPDPDFAGGSWLGLLPGSRSSAYADAVRLARVARELGRLTGSARALLSLAPGLDAARFAERLGADGWTIRAGGSEHEAFVAQSGTTRVVGWSGPLGTLLAAVQLVIGQAGTANEQAAALGRPVVALDAPGAGVRRAGPGEGWYRMRQRRLLGDALALVDADPEKAAGAIAALLSDEPRLARMRLAGPQRLGGPGGARAIAEAVLS